jgi:hypothetical protein
MTDTKEERKRQEQLIDELLKDYKGPESFWGQSGLYAELKKKIIERTLNAEMDHHLGYTKHDPRVKTAAIPAMARAKRLLSLAKIRLNWPLRETVTAPLSRS